MRRLRHRWAGCLALTAALTVLLFIGHLSAQAPGQGAGTLVAPAVPADEMSARLLSGPDGQVFRFWTRWTDLEAGGGGAFEPIGDYLYAQGGAGDDRPAA